MGYLCNVYGVSMVYVWCMYICICVYVVCVCVNMVYPCLACVCSMVCLCVLCVCVYITCMQAETRRVSGIPLRKGLSLNLNSYAWVWAGSSKPQQSSWLRL